MAPTHKLVYFNITGLGEPIRYLLAYGKIDFEDSRFEMADWDQYKAGTPFGKVPVLEIDGKQIHQCSAICRYFGKQIGLGGKNDWDALQADIAVDTITDYRLYMAAYFLEKDEAKKAEKLEEIQNVHNPFYLEKFDNLVAENGGYFVNGQLTIADIFFAALGDTFTNLLKEPIIDKYPNLKALKEEVDNLPGIKEYRQNRPQTLL